MFKIIPSKYNMKQVELKWYSIWEKKGYFHQDIDKSKKPFCIVMPPPNITGKLHLGHAIDNTIQDIIIRFKRMQGYNTLWVPGIDHAGIATQKKVEEDIREKDGIIYKNLNREKFLKKAWEWKDLYHEKIKKQLKLLGSSCDWKAERFTLDERYSTAVKKAFINLYKKGLIYKGKYIINWCPNCMTTISDIEVQHINENSFLWNLKYSILNSTKFIVVATTRPETIFGDTAIAVSPKDNRYKNFIGKYAVVPLTKKKIPIIEDEYIDKTFGTGAVKITPSHDPIDFEIAIKHNLKHISVINKEGKIISENKKYNNLDRFKCRKIIINDLKKSGNLISFTKYVHSIGKCSRCNTIIEPLVSNQWFVNMKIFAKKELKEIVKKESIFIPNRFIDIYINWLKNIKDWCISRQLWWGHRIPIWYCKDCKNIIASIKNINKCNKCKSSNIKQDEDVLDTWFSSALWPFSSLGWPKKTNELKNFYPISLLVTGRDIIFFWVARMLFMGLEFMKKIPFEKIFIHGLILDNKGRKMSKSLGNGIDPIEIINNYGADSLRFMLITNNTPGNDIYFQKNKLERARNFCNKIWNASRFLILNLENYQYKNLDLKLLTLADKWILTKFNQTIESITNNFNNYELGFAADKIYEFIWNFFCDWYIEIAKIDLYSKNLKRKQLVQWILNLILVESIKLLHPFMPFITEEIWQYLLNDGETIMLSKWPIVNKNLIFEKEQKEMNNIIEGIKAIRNLKVEMNVPIHKKIEIFLYINKKNIIIAKKSIVYFKNLVNAKKITIITNLKNKPKKSAIKITSIFQIYLPLVQLIDLKIEKQRLIKELEKLTSIINKLKNKLNDLNFINNAPKIIIEKEKNKFIKNQHKFNFIKNRLGEL